MTVIVACKHNGEVLMSADLCEGTDYSKNKTTSKIHKLDNDRVMMGLANDAMTGHLFLDHFEAQLGIQMSVKDAYKEAIKETFKELSEVNHPDELDSHSISSMIAVKGCPEIYISYGLVINEVNEDFFAIGGGADVAMGAMHYAMKYDGFGWPGCHLKKTNQVLEMAVEAACEYSQGCQWPEGKVYCLDRNYEE